MAFLRHLAQKTVPASLDENELRVGYFFRENLGRLDVVACASLMSVLAANDDQSRSFDLVDQVRCFVALPRHHMA